MASKVGLVGVARETEEGPTDKPQHGIALWVVVPQSKVARE